MTNVRYGRFGAWAQQVQAFRKQCLHATGYITPTFFSVSLVAGAMGLGLLHWLQRSLKSVFILPHEQCQRSVVALLDTP